MSSCGFKESDASIRGRGTATLGILDGGRDRRVLLIKAK